MKRTAALLLSICILTGCAKHEDGLEPFIGLRKALLEANICSFQASITADYSESVYIFQMDCAFSRDGTLSFTVTDPETIAGITGKFTDQSAGITFDDKLLAFPVIADGQLTPVSAPWVFLNALRGGYMRAFGTTDDAYCLYISDSENGNPIELEIYTNNQYIPIRAEIIWENRRILSLDIRNFTLQ